MSGKARPSMRKNVLDRLDSSNLSETSKDCIKEVFERYEEHVQIERAINQLFATYEAAKTNDHIRNPIEFALYETWKEFDKDV